ncbi:hypothetical protein [Flavobacterium piscisymbiosum]|uniref:Uncharacterized protein n=1 Tax=Flavobacterium piscisymbiosum TaxID=2893753 RepID=A0ABS8MG19_9FLAO|nr:hypothetical protein [Flavobacterium sp. F-30]MCC9064450.1 hypothetical protein [Flavobacterium sp. F-30]
MKPLKNILGALLIIGVLFPMLLFLNPFAWGMRRAPEYVPSKELEKVLEAMKKEINTYEQVDVDTYNNTANLWYLRDCQNKRLDSLENFEIQFSEVKNDAFVKEKIKKYAPLIEKQLECNCYDSLIFKYELKENEMQKVVLGFKIK